MTLWNLVALPYDESRAVVLNGKVLETPYSLYSDNFQNRPEWYPSFAIDLVNARLEWRRAPDSRWKEHVLQRFASGEVFHLPASWDRFNDDRMPHLSHDFRNLIGFFESEEKGQLDIVTKMKPGRYLKRFYPELSMEVQRSLCDDIVVAFEDRLHIARDPAEIVSVYENGPNSCMTGANADWNFDKAFVGYTNPSCVYGNGDLAIAYIGTAQKPIARCVVWPERGVASDRIYGHEARMIAALRYNGYHIQKSGEWLFEGARVRRIPAYAAGHKLVMPYMDVAKNGVCTPDGKFVILTSRPSRKAMNLKSTRGSITVSDNLKRCILSGHPLKGRSDVVKLRGQGRAIKDEVISQGYRDTIDQGWACPWRAVRTKKGIEYYTFGFVMNNKNFVPDWFSVCGEYLKRDYPDLTRYYADRSSVYWTSKTSFETHSSSLFKSAIYFGGNYYADLSVLQKYETRLTHPCPDYEKAIDNPGLVIPPPPTWMARLRKWLSFRWESV